MTTLDLEGEVLLAHLLSEKSVEDVVARTVDERVRRSGAVHVSGDDDILDIATSLISQGLTDAGKQPLLLAPPIGYLDAGMAALVDLAVGLQQFDGLRADADGVLSPATRLGDRLASLAQRIEALSDRLVLIVRQPTRWLPVSPVRPFSDFAREVAAFATELRSVPLVVIGAVNYHVQIASAHLVERNGPPEGTSVDSFTVERLRQAADLLFDNAEPAFWTAGKLSATELSSRFAETVARARRHRHFFAALARVALFRRPVPYSWVIELIEDVGLSEPERDAMDLLLVPSPGGLVLLSHLTESVRELSASIDGVRLSRPRDCRRVYEMYGRSASELLLRGAGAGFQAEFEQSYFAGQAADLELVGSSRIYFTEQLHALAWRFSYELARTDAAEELLEQSLSYREEALAHHELGRLLDQLGVKAHEVQEHYEKALALDSAEPSYYGRLIAFLLVVGEVNLAERFWDESRERFRASQLSDVGVCRSLHVPVLTVALRRAELRLATQVMQQVPESVRSALPEYQLAERRLRALDIAREYGSCVPGDRLGEDWWAQPPTLLPARRGEKARLEWLAGRIEEVDEGEVHFRVARVDPRTASFPETGWMSLSVETFFQLCEDMVGLSPAQFVASLRALVGTFIEIGLYGRDAADVESVIRLMTSENDRIDILDPEFDTQRYLLNSEVRFF